MLRSECRSPLFTRGAAPASASPEASAFGGEGPEGPQPEEGDTKFIAGELYVYKNGRWEKVVKPTGPGAGTDKDPTIDILRKNLELKNQLIKDDFERELAMLWANHNKKIDALEEQLKTQRLRPSGCAMSSI